ncbi:MAG: glycerate kinase [Lachnospiraceae bacterium]|nr:glycerate kinase [Lachnospiraceae bacterium]
MGIRQDADYIIKESIKSVLPDEAVIRALKGKTFDTGKLYVVAAGKASWQMAKTASEVLGDRIEEGVVCTKYDHVKGEIPQMKCFEGGHPIPDKNSYIGTQAALDLAANLKKDDTVLFLLSGGGSALFEKSLVSETELANVTKQLLECGADISEINTIRKRLSAVKGGKFAKWCEPAHVYCIVLSDVIGDPLDMIASGPAYPDSSTSEQALQIVEKYGLNFSEETLSLLKEELPKDLHNVETIIAGNVKNLCTSAKEACEKLGYHTVILTDEMTCQAKEAGSFLGAIARSHQDSGKSLAFIAGGETVVCITGKGKGGRNQEIALAAAEKIAGLKDTAVFSVGSDGTDGPTDAAGGYVDGTTKEILQKKDIDIFQVLKDNDAYHALEKTNGLIITGATGTNVNDVAVVLIKR